MTQESGTGIGAPLGGASAGAAPLRVRVVHGNLAFARHPVAVGHYSGDTIVSAEKHLDRALHGALSRRLHLGLYPGPIGTSAVFSNPRTATDPYARPGGAIVVGLGTVGGLTASSLSRTFSRALLEFVLERVKEPERAAPGAQPGLGVATLLIGTGAGGMSVGDSVFALVRGAQEANKALAAAQQSERVDELEIIELYEDRAILALEVLDRLSKRSGADAGFALHEHLGRRDGGLQRVSFEDETADWWHRLQVLGAAEEGGRATGLRFAAVTRRARAEVTLLPTQRAIVDQFVRGALETVRHDAGVGRTLFDLLLPNELKESAPDEDNLILMLDEESARYPWELLEDSADRAGRPFVIDRGLLRQLESTRFRAVVRSTAQLSALVIGDPVSPFVELKGAQAEATAVSNVLVPRFATVTTLVRSTGQEVVTALFERPFKVLHLAAHGVYRYAPPRTGQCAACGHSLEEAQPASNGPEDTVTGMVIGDGVFLTPGEVAQMRNVPDLVFINCCHLGQVEAGREHATPQERAFPQLAANVATEFIRMGVRAVVAAGWAVEDSAAVTFATTFYEEMLNGEPFGEAVKAARAATYRRHKPFNTWGAYQCYGDPDFRLVLTQSAGTDRRAPSFLSPAHALRDIGNIAARLKTHSSERHDDEVQRLDRIVAVLREKKWLDHGSITAALGRAYGEAGELERATDYYCAALSSEDGAVTARDMEQWANLIGRIAVEKWTRNPADPETTRQAVREVRRSIYVLKEMLGGHEGERLTSERLSLIGSAYKRLAWIDPAERPEALAQMAKYYELAAERAIQRGVDSAYPRLNAWWAALAMQWQGLSAPAVEGRALAEDLAAVRAEIARREASEGPQFWQDSMRVDCDLLEAIDAGIPAESRIKELADLYVARRQYASARQFASVRDQLDFLVAMSARRPEVSASLALLRRAIGGDVSPATAQL
jgi:hypothetical protein